MPGMRTPFAVALAVLTLAAGCGKEEPASSGRDGVELPGEASALVEALASPNEAPQIYTIHLRYPEGYDRQAQARVRAAEEKLRAMGPKAFPALIERLDDTGYSYTECYGTWRNLKVGEVCFYIIEDQVEFYGHDYATRPGADGEEVLKPSYLYTFHTTQHLRNWWEERQDMTLRELQIEALEWNIEKERERGFTDDEQRETVLAPLLRRLAELKSGR